MFHRDTWLLRFCRSYPWYMHDHFSCVWFFATLWTVAHQAPLSMGFSRQEYWSGLPFPSAGNLLDPGIKPASLRSPALAGGFFTTGATWDALVYWKSFYWTIVLFIPISRKGSQLTLREKQWHKHFFPQISFKKLTDFCFAVFTIINNLVIISLS